MVAVMVTDLSSPLLSSVCTFAFPNLWRYSKKFDNLNSYMDLCRCSEECDSGCNLWEGKVSVLLLLLLLMSFRVHDG